MDEEKVLAPRLLLPEPPEGPIHGLASGTLGVADAAAGSKGDGVLVEGEPLSDAGLPPEDPGRDRRPRAPSPIPEPAGQPGGIGFHGVSHVVPDPVLRGKPAGEDRCVGGESQGVVRVGPLEEDGILHELLETRCLDLPVAVGRESVRAEGIHTDHDHRSVGEGTDGRRWIARRSLVSACAATEDRGDKGQRHEGRHEPLTARARSGLVSYRRGRLHHGRHPTTEELGSIPGLRLRDRAGRGGSGRPVAGGRTPRPGPAPGTVGGFGGPSPGPRPRRPRGPG